ncbi:hypothetical protein RND71_034501 [Anisodus tanguticus]|uniref:Pentatricopeptide repeat-containing protein n=1 Tax=Anisodus tanguticus TaxID=243964 RepID=A0AAE1RCA1_9SOLA|nr:hypothetical protein RND71_034501 [Anisodus tanguticus]
MACICPHSSPSPLALRLSLHCRPTAKAATTTVIPFLDQRLRSDRRLIHEQCKNGKIVSAFRLIRLIEENNLAPNEWTYCTHDGLCERGRVEEAHTVFNSMKEKGLKVNVTIYIALIDGYCKAKKVDFALMLFEKMIEEGCYSGLESSLFEKMIEEPPILCHSLVAGPLLFRCILHQILPAPPRKY